MVTGETPFQSDFEMDMYKKLLAGNFTLSSNFSGDLEKLLKALIHVDQSMRLGRTKGGICSIMQNSWYSNLNWQFLELKKLKVRKCQLSLNSHFKFTNLKQYTLQLATLPNIEEDPNKPCSSIRGGRRSSEVRVLFL